MLLGHRAGIPDWDSPALDEQVARDPAKVWKVAEFLDLAAAKPPLFAPGTSFSYSNTDYTLLGLIIERITGRSWRHEVTRRVIRPLRLTRTRPARPRAPVDQGPARARLRRARRPVGRREPRPLVRRRRRRLRAGHHGRRPRALPGRAARGPAVPPPRDAEADADHRRRRRARAAWSATGSASSSAPCPAAPSSIGHLGGAVYRSYVGRLHPTNVTIALAMNAEDDPTPLLLPAVEALLATRR